MPVALTNITRSLLTISLVVLLATLPLSSGSAYRVLGQLEEAYEVMIDDVRFPANADGVVVFRPCDGCAQLSLRVIEDTTYQIDGFDLDYADFSQAIEAVRNESNVGEALGISIFFDIERQRVNRILVNRFPVD